MKTVNLKEFVKEMRNFLMTFDPEKIYDDYYSLFAFVCKNFVEILKIMNKLILGIKPFKRAIQVSRKFESEVTIFHRYFAYCCLKAKCYSLSLDIINSPALKFQSSANPLIYDLINYHYYRGMLFTGLEMYPQAFQCFKLVIELPHGEIHIM